MKKKYDVSIISANYNNKEFLIDYFESIVQSTVEPMELLFLDDASTDGSVEICEKYVRYPFIKCIRNSKNEGLANSLNRLIELANGKYILRLDPDDFITADRIEKQVNFLNNNPEVDVVGSNAIYFNHQRKKEVFSTRFPLDSKEIHRQYKAGYHGLIHGSVMIRTNLMVKYRYHEIHVPAEEYDLFSRMAKDGVRMVNMPDALLYYRLHDRNTKFYKTRDSITKSIRLRREIFGITTSLLAAELRIQHSGYYRKGLAASGPFCTYYYLFLSILFNPIKLYNRIFKHRA